MGLWDVLTNSDEKELMRQQYARNQLAIEREKRMGQEAELDRQLKQMQIAALVQAQARDEALRGGLANIPNMKIPQFDESGYFAAGQQAAAPFMLPQFNPADAPIDYSQIPMAERFRMQGNPQLMENAPRTDMSGVNAGPPQLPPDFKMPDKAAFTTQRPANEQERNKKIEELLLASGNFSDYAKFAKAEQDPTQLMLTKMLLGNELSTQRDMAREDRRDARSEADRKAAEDRFLKTMEHQNALLDKRLAAAERARDNKANKPNKSLPASVIGDLSDAKQIIDTLSNSDELSADVATGPFTGRAQSALAVFGLAPQKFTDLSQKLQTVQNIMLKLRSGAAVTDQEYSRFLKEMPTVNDAPETRKVKLSNALNYAQDLFNTKTQLYEEGGYKVPQSVRSGPRASTAKKGAGIKSGRFTVREVR